MQLFYRIDLPADDGDLVQRCLNALKPCSTEKVHVDLSVHNAARICRLPGTMNRKGDEISGRIHRMAEVLETPEEIEVVSEALLQNLIIPETEAKTSSFSDGILTPAKDFNLRGEIEPILEKHGWTLVDETDQQYWLRPGNPTNKYSAKYNGKTFYVHSPNAEPFGVGPNSRFDVYAKLEHGGNVSAAMDALTAQGYGQKDDDVDLSGLLANLDTTAADSPLATAGSIVHSNKTPEADTGDMSALNQRNLLLTRSDQIQMKSPKWLLRGILEQDTMALIFGEPGCGKSFLTIDWACRVATGTPWRGHEITPDRLSM